MTLLEKIDYLKNGIKVEKKINPLFHYFLLFWFIFTLLVLAAVIFLIFQFRSEIITIFNYLKMGFSYVSSHNQSIISFLNSSA